MTGYLFLLSEIERHNKTLLDKLSYVANGDRFFEQIKLTGDSLIREYLALMMQSHEKFLTESERKELRGCLNDSQCKPKSALDRLKDVYLPVQDPELYRKRIQSFLEGNPDNEQTNPEPLDNDDHPLYRRIQKFFPDKDSEDLPQQ